MTASRVRFSLEPATVLVAAAVPAWGLLLFGGSGALSLPELCTGRLIATVPGEAELAFVLAWVSPWALVTSWAVMISAMMMPLLTGPLGHVRARSFRRDVAAATLAFLASYLAVWMAAGVAVVGLALAMRVSFGASTVPVFVALTLAFAWQTTPWKRMALNRCHARPPLAVRGRRPLSVGAGFGTRHGLWCVASCAPIMAAALVAPSHGAVAMALAAIWIWAERLETPQVPAPGLLLPRRAARAARHHLLRHARPHKPAPLKMTAYRVTSRETDWKKPG